jgi:pyridoxine 4-dehydrogenase
MKSLASTIVMARLWPPGKNRQSRRFSSRPKTPALTQASSFSSTAVRLGRNSCDHAQPRSRKRGIAKVLATGASPRNLNMQRDARLPIVGYIVEVERRNSMQNTSAARRGKGPTGVGGEFLIGDDLRVGRLGFGAMRITGKGIWGEPADRAEAIRVLRRAVDLGINFIDTADSYGPNVSEEIIAEALHPYPAGLVIATKGGFERPGPNQWVENGRPAHLKAACEGSLRRLRLDRIDLYQLHRIDPKVPAEDQLDALKQLQAQGKIRHIGLSEVSVRQIRHAQGIVPIVSVQNRYSLADRGSEEVLEYCEKQRIGFIPWFPLAAGQLSGGDSAVGSVAAQLKATPSQVALAWLLARSPVILPIPGTSRVEHLEENVAAVDLKIAEDTMRQLAGPS